jgi:hypothetical protein
MTMGHPLTDRPRWAWLTGACVSLALLILLLSGCAVPGAANASTTPTGTLTSAASATASVPAAATAKCGDPFDYSSVPAAPTAIPGPQAAHISATVAADPHGSARTTHITAGDKVYVFALPHGLPAGESHVVSIAWYVTGQRLDLPQSDATLAQTLTFGLFC